MPTLSSLMALTSPSPPSPPWVLPLTWPSSWTGRGASWLSTRRVAWVDKAVASGADIYGITTGFGACSDKRTFEVEALQVEFLRHLTAGIFGPGSAGAQPLSTTRAAMAVRLNGLVGGLSGIRWEVLEALAKLVNANVIPRCPLRGTVTASGDLLPLCYMAGLLVAWPTSKAYVKGGEELIPATEALKLAGIEKPIKLGAKEGLALANGTSFATAEAALVLFDVHVLFLLVELCGGLFCEVMFVRSELAEPMLHEAKHHRGQIEVGATLHWLLQGSLLIERGDEIYACRRLKKPKQDRYASHSIPHWLGPQLESIQHAAINVQNEANSANDNPLIDIKQDRCFHGANFQGTFVGFPMDTVRISVAAMGRLLFAQFSELMLEMTNNGLTGNLALGPDFALDFGLKGADTAMASYLSELLHLANPMTTLMQSAEQHNQDVNSVGLISARKTAEAIHILKMMLASTIVALCQAADLRHLEEIFEKTIASTLQKEAAACGLHPSLTSELVEICVGKQNVMEYAHDVTNPSLPFMSSLNTKLLQHMMEQVGIDEKSVESPTLSQSLKSFKSSVQSKLVEKIDEARASFLESQKSDLIISGRIANSKAFPLYRFVRKQLKAELITGTKMGCRSADQDLQRVFDAISDRSIIPPLLECFKGYPKASNIDVAGAASDRVVAGNGHAHTNGHAA